MRINGAYNPIDLPSIKRLATHPRSALGSLLMEIVRNTPDPWGDKYWWSILHTSFDARGVFYSYGDYHYLFRWKKPYQVDKVNYRKGEYFE